VNSGRGRISWKIVNSGRGRIQDVGAALEDNYREIEASLKGSRCHHQRESLAFVSGQEYPS